MNAEQKTKKEAAGEVMPLLCVHRASAVQLHRHG